MKKIIVVFLLMINVIYVFSASVPKWVLDVDSEYPKETYLARLGSGKTIENAQANALGQLASYFDSHVEVDTKTSSLMVSKNNEVEKTQSLNQEVNVVSGTNLVGVEYSKSFYHKKEKKYYIVAYMNRAEAWKNIEDKINLSYERFENCQNMITETSNPFLKFKYSRKANAAGEEFLEETHKGFLINPTKRKEYKSKVSEVNVKIEENSQVSLPVVLVSEGDYENLISTVVANEFKKFGFIIKSAGSKGSECHLLLNINSNEKNEDDVCFVFPEISISLMDSKGEKKYYSFERKWGKTAGFSLTQAQKKAFSKISEELSSALSDDIKNIF